MNLGLKGTRIAIAGSSKGLGLSIAQSFREEGASVWLTGRNADSLKQASQALGGSPATVCDLETEQGREAFFKAVSKEWRELDGLILNVGSGRSSEPGIDASEAEWQRVFNLNFFTHASLLKKFRPLLKKSKHGAVVSVSSIAGQMRLPAPLSYGTAKAALNHFCASACAELAQDGIRFNVVSPGNILAPGGRWEELMKQNPEKVKKYIDESVPLKRFAKPEEIAAFVVFLASPAAAFSTGSVIKVDGGQAPFA